jgi:hypothetical protein
MRKTFFLSIYRFTAKITVRGGERKVLAEKRNKQSSNIECYAHPRE